MIELPPKAKRKLADLVQAAADAEALSNAIPDRVMKLGKDVATMSQIRSTFEQSDPRSETLRREIAEAQQQQEQLVELASRRKERADGDRQIVQHINAEIARLPHGISLVDVETPRVNEADLPAAITAARDQIAELKHRLRDMKNTPLPKDELKERARQYVQSLGRDAQLRLHGTSRDQKFELEHQPKAPLLLLCGLVPDVVVQGLERMIDEQVADDGLPAAQRKKQTAELEKLLLSIERHEEALVLEARLRGHDIVRRIRPDWRALVGVEIKEKRAREAAKARAPVEDVPLEMHG